MSRTAQVLYITCKDHSEAKNISTKLLKKKLIACANIVGGVQSFYWWQGEIANDQEVVIFAKTTSDHIAAITEFVKEQHSYDCPGIVSWDIKEGNQEFIDWIKGETSGT